MVSHLDVITSPMYVVASDGLIDMLAGGLVNGIVNFDFRGSGDVNSGFFDDTAAVSNSWYVGFSWAEEQLTPALKRWFELENKAYESP